MKDTEKSIGRPEKKIVINNEKFNNHIKKNIIDVHVIVINNRKYYKSKNNQIYDIKYHINIGRLIENRIYFNNNELEFEEYI